MAPPEIFQIWIGSVGPLKILGSQGGSVSVHSFSILSINTGLLMILIKVPSFSLIPLKGSFMVVNNHNWTKIKKEQ